MIWGTEARLEDSAAEARKGMTLPLPTSVEAIKVSLSKKAFFHNSMCIRRVTSAQVSSLFESCVPLLYGLRSVKSQVFDARDEFPEVLMFVESYACAVSH